MILLGARRLWQTRWFYAASVLLCLSAIIGQQANAQSTAPVKAAPVFVPMPKDIQCELSGMSFRSAVGANAQPTETSGSVDGVACWITGKTPEQKKDVSLASNDITRGMLTTKDFGKWKVTPLNSVNSSGLSIAIRHDNLPSLRAFLQKSDAEKDVEPASVAASQQSASPPSKPQSDNGASLEVTMKFIQDKLNALGKVSHTVYFRSGGDEEQSLEITLVVTKVLADPANCRIAVDWATDSSSFSLRDVQTITVKTGEEADKEDLANSPIVFRDVRVDPPFFALLVRRAGNAKEEFDFYDQGMANQVAKAMTHAVELCGGASKAGPL